MIRKLVLLSLSVVLSLWMFAGNAPAQTITPIYSFSESTNSSLTNSDGVYPLADLILSGNTLYGTAIYGGPSGNGTIFKVNTDGTGFSNLYSFSGPNEPEHVSVINEDGAYPKCRLVLSGSTLYGTASTGGSAGAGTVFAINTDGAGFTNLHTFTDATNDGSGPGAGLVLSGNTLYGTTGWGGTSNKGTVFAINTDGSGFTNLYSFTGTNEGGVMPSGLILSGSTLYGTANAGGILGDGPSFTEGNGMVFSLNTDGTGFTVLHNFSPDPYPFYNYDGASPRAGLILSSNTLYGTASSAGGYNFGNVFAVNINGSGFTNLYSFLGGDDGEWPIGGLTLGSNTLYGTASEGGIPSGIGTVFAINTDGTGFATLGRFDLTNTGYCPDSSLLLASNALYGTAMYGGTSGNGTVFKYTITPTVHPAFFSGENGLKNGVYYLSFAKGNLFGYYTYAYFPYLYHFDLGFEYFMDTNDGQGNAYLYDFTTGHFWYTGPQLFPYIYDFSLNAWLYYYADANHAGHYTSNPRWFYNFGTSNFITQ